MLDPSTLPPPSAVATRRAGAISPHPTPSEDPRRGRAGAGDTDSEDARWDALLQDVIEGRPLRPEHFSAPSEYWSDYLGPILDRPWSVLPFFDTEFCFYLAINTLAGFFSTGLDVFAPIKRRALHDALPQVSSALAAIPDEGRLPLLDRRARGQRSRSQPLREQRSGRRGICGRRPAPAARLAHARVPRPR